MHNHIMKGKYAESMAVTFLQEKGFRILDQNWRHGHFEIDIIGTKNGVIHFIEVKARWGLGFGHPEEGVGRKKFRHIQNASNAYLGIHHQWKKIQFDVLSIYFSDGKNEIRYFEDIYFP